MEWCYLLDSPRDKNNSIYAVAILLPEYLERIIAPMRARFDPLCNLISPHITLVHPFETDRPLDEVAALVREETGKCKPLSLNLTSIGDFYPGIPKIYWNIEKDECLSELFYRLYSQLGQPIPYKNYQPHITIAREISMHRVLAVKEQVIDYLPDESFEVSGVDLMTPLPGGRWVSVRTFLFNND
jgi:2'-5' RNA ligase